MVVEQKSSVLSSNGLANRKMMTAYALSISSAVVVVGGGGGRGHGQSKVMVMVVVVAVEDGWNGGWTSTTPMQ